MSSSAGVVRRGIAPIKQRKKLLRYVARRIFFGVLTLWVVSIVVFGTTQAIPGNAARAQLGRMSADAAALHQLEHRLGLDRPVVQQYWSWFTGVLHGDFGVSLAASQGLTTATGSGAPLKVTTYLGPLLANSMFLVAIASVIVFPISILVGAYSAYRRDKLLDHTLSFTCLGLSALPEFVIALAVILILSTAVFHLFPAVSLIDQSTPVWDQLSKVVLPVLTLIIWEFPYMVRLVRSTMIEVLESDYVEMARLKGVRERKIVLHHALPNAIVPIVQVIAIQIAFMIGSIVVIEYIFGFPGVGQAMVSAVSNSDLPVVQAAALFIAAAYVLLNLLADIWTILISPRLRTSYTG
jgi:peptide/nickel transport system permease protein